VKWSFCDQAFPCEPLDQEVPLLSIHNVEEREGETAYLQRDHIVPEDVGLLGHYPNEALQLSPNVEIFVFVDSDSALEDIFTLVEDLVL